MKTKLFFFLAVMSAFVFAIAFAIDYLLLSVGWFEDTENAQKVSPTSNKSLLETKLPKPSQVAKSNFAQKESSGKGGEELGKVSVLSCSSETIDLMDLKTRMRIIAEAVAINNFHKKGEKGKELSYLFNGQAPYTGWMKSTYDNRRLKVLEQFSAGKRDGLSIELYQSGRLKLKECFKDDLLHGPRIEWYFKGRKKMEGNWNEGKKDGLEKWWYGNGEKKSEKIFSDGKFMSAVVWKPNGDKCPVTNLVDGDGIWVWYFNDGSEKSRHNIKDGKFIKN